MICSWSARRCSGEENKVGFNPKVTIQNAVGIKCCPQDKCVSKVLLLPSSSSCPSICVVITNSDVYLIYSMDCSPNNSFNKISTEAPPNQKLIPTI